MRLVTLGLVTLIALAAPGPAAARADGADTPLVRVRDGHGSDLLFRVNPRTLQQVGRPIRTFRNAAGLGFSPGGGRIAYSGGRGRQTRIHLVDLRRWRSLGIADLGWRGSPLSVGWVSGDRVLAWTQYARRQRLFWIDARTKRLVARRSFSGWAWDPVPVPGGLVLPLVPREGVGPLRLAFADPHGGLRIIELEGIDTGADYEEPGARVLTPAVTADPESGRVYVLAARGRLVAEVDLASGAVSYHSLGADAAKGNVDVWWRAAVWAGDGRIAVTGDRWVARRDGRAPGGPVPFGARIVDIRTWSMTTLDPRPDSLQVAGDTVLASGTRRFAGGRGSESTGLLAFDAGGRRIFTRFRGLPVALLANRDGLAYVWIRRTRTAHVIDLDSGRTRGTIRTGQRIPFLLSP